jgi:rubredoxin
MSDVRASALLTCPDCGGILEPSRPLWLATIDVTAALGPAEPAPAAWRCLLCGYHAAHESSPPGAPRAHGGPSC